MADDLHRDEQGAASMIAFMIAGVLFMSVIGVVLLAGDQVTRPVQDDNQSAEQVVSANSLADVLMGGPGYRDSSGPVLDWAPDPDDPAGTKHYPDNIHRFGLMDTNGRIDFGKLENLRLAPLADDPSDGHLNYPEASRSLGLDDADMDFHIRAFPSLKSVREILDTGIKDENMRVTYLGHPEISSSEEGGDPTEGLEVTDPLCAASATEEDQYELSVRVTNGGSAHTVFSARFHALLSGYEIDETVHDFLVQAGTHTDLALPVPNTSAIACSVGSTIEVEVWGPAAHLKTVSTTLIEDVLPAPDSPAPRYFSVDPGDIYYLQSDLQQPGANVVISYAGDLSTGDALSLDVTDTTGTSIFLPDDPMAISVHNNQNKWNVQVAGSKFTSGTDYTIHLTRGTTSVTDRLVVLPSEPQPFSPAGGSIEYSFGDSIDTEVRFLHELVDKFCPFYFEDTDWSPLSPPPPATPDPKWTDRCGSFASGRTPDQPGDIFFDDKHSVNSDLRKRLLNGNTPRYDIVNTLVVGSNVAHNSLTSQAIKGAIESWVLGGGNLIVFGHDEQNVQWLQPLFHAGIQTSSGAIAVPDASHPILHVPNDLDTPSYENRDQTWKFNAGHDTLFTHVIKQDDNSVLAINNPGAFQKGNIILTSWLPYDLFDTEGLSPDEEFEARALVHNLLSQGYRDLFLDYGPPLPTQGGSAPSWRIGTVEHPQLGPVELTIQFWVF